MAALEGFGNIRRTHGGARLVQPSKSDEFVFNVRDTQQVAEKEAIGRACAALVPPGQNVIFDAGTTCFHAAKHLGDKAAQLITNSLPIGNLFLNDDSVELLLTGGLVYPRYGVLLGPHVETFLGSIHASTLFLSCAGVHEGSVYNQNLLLVQAEQGHLGELVEHPGHDRDTAVHLVCRERLHDLTQPGTTDTDDVQAPRVVTPAPTVGLLA